MKFTRRDFIHAGCAATAVTLAPHFLDVAEARSIHGSTLSGFGGGKTQTNLEFTSYPFINVLKAASGDVKNAGTPLFGAPADPTVRDANGYPTSIQASGWFIAVTLPSAVDRPGNWIETWDGNGTIRNLTTAVSYTISGAVASGGKTILTLALSSPVSPNTSTANQLKTLQNIQIAGTLSGGTWNSLSFKFYQILDAAVGGDPTKIKIDVDSIGLGTWTSGGSVMNALTNKTTAGVACPGRYVYTPPSNGSFPITSQLPGVSSMDAAPNYIRNFAMYHADDEAAYLAGQVWSPKYISKLCEGNFGVLRSLDLQNANIQKTANWSQRKPATYVAFNSPSWFPASISPSGLTTTNIGSAYSLAWAGFTLTDKAVVHAFFNVSAAGAATLNVNGTGNINILNESSGSLSSGSNSLIEGGTTNSFATLIYIAAINAWIKMGGCAIPGSSGFMTYLPPELLLDLCVAVGAHPYVIGCALDDTMDWATNYATYFKNNGPSWMVPRFENPNELFNNGPGFDQHGYAVAQQLVIDGGWDTSTGAPSGTTYSVTAVTVGSTTDVTFNVAFTGQVGALLETGGTWNGLSGISNAQFLHVLAVNVGGNPNKVTLQVATTGTWTSGGTAVASPGEYHEWSGTYLSKYGKAIHDVYAGDTTKYEVIGGISISGGVTTGDALSYNALFGSYTYVIQGGVAASTYATAVCTSNYIQSSEYNTSTETTRVAAWAPRQFVGYINGTALVVTSGTPPSLNDEISAFGLIVGTLIVGTAGDGINFTVDQSQTFASSGGPIAIYAGVPATRRTQEAAYVAAILTGTGQENLNTEAGYWLTIANWANGFGIKKMFAYEGGPDEFATGATSATDQFRFATNLHPDLQAIVKSTYDSWSVGQYPPVSNQYPSGFTATFPSQFFFAGDKPMDTAWSMLSDIYQTPDPPTWKAIKAYNGH